MGEFRALVWQTLSEQFGEGGDIGFAAGGEAVGRLKAFQGALRRGPHLTVNHPGIVAGAFELALQALDEV